MRWSRTKFSAATDPARAPTVRLAARSELSGAHNAIHLGPQAQRHNEKLSTIGNASHTHFGYGG
jgi:hypothetical protein